MGRVVNPPPGSLKSIQRGGFPWLALTADRNHHRSGYIKD